VTASTQVGGLWRPANGTEGADFEANWCRHCLHSKPNVWEDEFGNEVVSGCDIVDRAFLGHVIALEWVVRDGRPACTAFSEDPANPARCLKTMEMF